MPVKVLWRGDAVGKQITQVAREGLEEFAEAVILAKSRERVPHDQGALERDSGVTMTEVAGTPVALVWYGAGPASAYAVAQHEGLHFHHENGRQAKYLQSVVQEEAGNMPAAIAGRVTRETGA